MFPAVKMSLAVSFRCGAAVRPELHSFGLVGVSGWGFRWNGGGGVVVVEH